MKILLTSLNSKYVHSNLALRYLYESCRDICEDLSIKEYTINHDDAYVLNDLILGEYDVVCFSTYIWNVEQHKELAENLRAACPNITIIFGGPEVSFDSVQFLRENPSVDIIVRGEGEYTTRMLLDSLQNGGGLDKIKGLTIRRSGSIGMTGDTELLLFESIPFPYSSLPIEKDKVCYYESARGCPYRCSYCLSSLDKKMRSLPLERVEKEIETFLYAGVPQVKFLDRSFNWDPDRAYDVFRYIIRHDLGHTQFHFELIASLLNMETLSLLEKAREGLFQFEIGVQSVNRLTLEAVDRENDISETLEKTRRLISLGNCEVHVDLIAGLPFEGYGDFKKSFNAVYELKANAFELGFLKLLHGTKIRNEAAKYGYSFRKRAPYEVISNEFISAADMARLRQIERLLDLYYNRGGFSGSLDYFCRVLAKTPFDFFEEFAFFFNLRGYQDRNHKKEDLYRILMEYARWKTRKDEGLRSEIEFLIEQDLRESMNPEAVRRFMRKGWEL